MAKEYLNNKELYDEIVFCKNNGKLSDKALNMFLLLSERVISRLPYADNYLREECLSGARIDLIKYWKNFNPIYTNAFAYFTQICKRGAAKQFDISYKFGKKFKGELLSMSGGTSGNSDEQNEIYTI